MIGQGWSKSSEIPLLCGACISTLSVAYSSIVAQPSRLCGYALLDAEGESVLDWDLVERIDLIVKQSINILNL